MFARAWHYLVALFQLNRPTGPTMADMENMDVATSEDLTQHDLERLILEDGEVVGSTAIVEEEEIVVTDGPQPDPSKSEYGLLS